MGYPAILDQLGRGAPVNSTAVMVIPDTGLLLLPGGLLMGLLAPFVGRLYDDTVVVLTADHGLSLRLDTPRRSPVEENLDERRAS